MTEIRYIEQYEDGILINSIPYQVSDEQLAAEAEQLTCENYLALSPAVITQPQIWYLLRAFAKKLGYTIHTT